VDDCVEEEEVPTDDGVDVVVDFDDVDLVSSFERTESFKDGAFTFTTFVLLVGILFCFGVTLGEGKKAGIGNSPALGDD